MDVTGTLQETGRGDRMGRRAASGWKLQCTSLLLLSQAGYSDALL